MRKYLVIVLVSLIPILGMSQVSVFSKVSLETGKMTPVVTTFSVKSLTEKVSFTCFSLVSQGWAEALIGVNYSVTPSIQFGLSAGLDQAPGLLRIGTSLWIGKGKTSFLALAEKGSGTGNYFYKVTLSRKVSDQFTLGLRAWIVAGIGPVVEYNYKAVKLWVMPTTKFFGDGGNNIMFGVDVKI